MNQTVEYDLPELYQKLTDFTSDSCRLLSVFYRMEDYAGKIAGIEFVDGPEIQPLFFLEEPYISRLFNEKYRELKEQESFMSLLTYIEKENIYWNWNEAIDFLLFYFYLSKEFSFDKKIFDHLYNRLVKRKFKKEKRELIILPLQHFMADVDEIVLAGDIKIKRLSQKEVWKIKKHDSRYAGPLHPQDTQFALTKIHSYKTPTPHDWDVPSEEELNRQDIIDQLHLAVATLRIYKEGDLMTAIAKRNSIMNQHFLLIENPEQIFQDLKLIYRANYKTDAIPILNKYNAKYIFLSETTKTEFNITKLNYLDKDCFELVFSKNTKIYKSLCK